MEICGIYKITNTITGDFYIGSSKNVKLRWASHKWPSSWNRCPDNPMYQDMKKYGTDKFVFEILAEVEIDKLKEAEQQFIEMMKPTYNNYRAKGLDVERHKESLRKAQNKYQQSDKGKKSQNKYRQSDRYKKTQKEYQKSEKGKESLIKARNKYYNQLCSYNGETLTLCALSTRFRRQGLSNPTAEAKKYLIKRSNCTSNQ